MATSSKKDKLTEEAQKFVMRGQFDKAAKIYEQIVELEPAAINLRQKFAEILFKCSRNDDARNELEVIGRHFAKNGFFLKAIAVYKQLQKYFPGDISLSLTLAELNEKHGLIANALSEYKIVYEFHQREGNASEALAMLDRMQQVDPQNIPIKVKLAEAFIQREKVDEAYAVFTKAASLLLQRGDNATLTRVSARVQQLFPNKPDFMFDILTEQVDQGDSATVVDSIQNLLRSNPHDKRVWDLIVRTYRILGQPQRQKIACKHYLTFFPSEPDAMLGLISAVAEERNLVEALELLDKYEQTLIGAGYVSQLETVYHALDKINPINVRVIEGLVRVAAAAGKENEAQVFASKLKSLHSVSGGVSGGNPGPEASASPFFDDASEAADDALPPIESPFTDDNDYSSAPSFADYDSYSAEPLPETVGSFESPPSVFDMAPSNEEEIEIDIDIDYDSPFESLPPEGDAAMSPDVWLDSVGALFDSISTTPRGVRFGNEMDNSDAQSHFDLGQAFKEMGLFDEAINEFRQAAQEPSRRVECLIMQCACLRERGEVEKAISMLQALLKQGLTEDENCSVKYELATGYQMLGRREEATLLLNEIKTANPAFRDINSRLNAANMSDSLDFSDDDLLNF
jgi:tetratricopeptide (TPR) repeat protein